MAKATQAATKQNGFAFEAVVLKHDFDLGNKDKPNSMDIICIGDSQPFAVYPSDDVVTACPGAESMLPWSKVRIVGIICGKARVNKNGNTVNTPNLRVTQFELVDAA